MHKSTLFCGFSGFSLPSHNQTTWNYVSRGWKQKSSKYHWIKK